VTENIWTDPVSAVEAFCLASMCALHGGNREAKLPSELYPKGDENIYGRLFANLFRYLNNVLGDNGIPPHHGVPDSLAVLLVPHDFLFLQACVAQMQGDAKLAGSLLSQLEPFSQKLEIHFSLLKARHWRFIGDREKAISIYRKILDHPDLPLKNRELILDEMHSW
jgi:hypothetical protein